MDTTKGMTNKELHLRDQQNYLPTFRRMPLVFSHGSGATLWDVEG
ncbi:MAG: aspartate aminotransferase family protein, partial [Phaeodactylibacter sp.]|nr:aspartate aminotransferase family protein [Phaeodactylibacter sp.]